MTARELLLATTNRNKLREMQPLVAGLPFALLTLADFAPLAEPDENGATFRDNARIKALAYAEATGRLVVAEDSGLVIDALDGAPGVHSARFLGPDVSYPARFAEIFRRLSAASPRGRDARFCAAVAVVSGREVLFEREAWIDGEITTAAAGSGGFGYDPIFHYPPLGRTLAEMTLEEKSAVSHRARVFRELARWLRGYAGGAHAPRP